MSKNNLRKFSYKLMAILSLVTVFTGIFGVAMYNNNQNSEQADASTPTVWIHRFFKKPEPNAINVRDHYYTNNPNIVWRNRGNLTPGTPERHGYIFEGTRFGLYRPVTGTRCPANTTMLNAYYSHDQRIDHFLGFNNPSYSPSRYTFVENLGCIALKQLSGTVPLYQYWDTEGRNNFYTTDTNEAVMAGRPRGSKGNFIGYVIPRTNAKPVYEFNRLPRDGRYYTTNINDPVVARSNQGATVNQYNFNRSPFMVYDYNPVTETCAGPETSPLMIWYNPTRRDYVYRILDTPNVRQNQESSMRGAGYEKVMETVTVNGRPVQKQKALGCIRRNDASTFKPLYTKFNTSNTYHSYETYGPGRIVGYVN